MSTIQSMRIDEASGLRRFDSEEAANACKAENAIAWLDLQFSEPRETETWLDRAVKVGHS